LTEKRTAIQLFSGGLDSIIAARTIKEQGFDIVAIHYFTGFNCATQRIVAEGPDWRWTPAKSVIDAADYLGIRLLPMDMSGNYLEVMVDPKYGYGSAGNPCIDCRIFLLNTARGVMEREGADFIFTGEVLGQRPMSQNFNALRLVEKRSGLTGRLLRPLSAKLLEPTIPENEGIVDRGKLFDIQGRSRRRQQELAEQFGIDFYPSSGGGCLLTTPQFGLKFKDLLKNTKKEDITLTVLNSLLAGRHLRLPGGLKVIVGRREEENDFLERLLAGDYWRFLARDFKGPVVFAVGEPSEEEFPLISAITARYGKGRNEQEVAVIADRGGEERLLTVRPASPEETEEILIYHGGH